MPTGNARFVCYQTQATARTVFCSVQEYGTRCLSMCHHGHKEQHSVNRFYVDKMTSLKYNSLWNVFYKTSNVWCKNWYHSLIKCCWWLATWLSCCFDKVLLTTITSVNSLMQSDRYTLHWLAHMYFTIISSSLQLNSLKTHILDF